ncbi:MAG TPA: competence/damage-inducible protein A [Anaerolineae bacterium]|nr:competence/damage-inducible protein A [Anaerolineae bacterium]
MTTVEIVAVGNELLLGEVLDTNTHWLCRRITGLGGRVRRAAMVEDDVEAIAAEIRGALARGADAVFTTGGLGPTADDVTLAGVARAAGVPLEESEEALAMVRARYEELAKNGYIADASLTAVRRKMARLPRGSLPLANPVGTAPGVVLKVGEAAIISLPGVPQELKGMFESSLQPVLKELFGAGVFVEREVLVDCGDESTLAPIVSRVAADNPQVYVKSMARCFGSEKGLRVLFSAAGSDRAKVEAALDRALAQFERALAEAGFSIC